MENQLLQGSWEVQNYEEAELHLDLSFAYLDSSVFLCQGMTDEVFRESYGRGKVVLSNSFHAVELFLKAAICKKGKKTPGHHKLRELADEYEALYPQEEYKFDIPLLINYAGFEPDEVEKLKKQEPPIDQHHRYHTDKSGEPWSGAFGFESSGMLEILLSIKKDFERLVKPIFGDIIADKCVKSTC